MLSPRSIHGRFDNDKHLDAERIFSTDLISPAPGAKALTDEIGGSLARRVDTQVTGNAPVSRGPYPTASTACAVQGGACNE
jgi:hypothetical protein